MEDAFGCRIRAGKLVSSGAGSVRAAQLWEARFGGMMARIEAAEIASPSNFILDFLGRAALMFMVTASL